MPKPIAVSRRLGAGLAIAGALLLGSMTHLARAAEDATSPDGPLATRFYGSGPSVAPLPAPGVPALPAWTLIPRSDKSAPLGTFVLPPGVPDIVERADLQAHGYVEEEYLISGAANVYTAGGRGVAKPNVAYTTRILVRRPADPSKFSGTVYMEPARDETEWPTVIVEAWPYMLRHGDVFVAVTTSKGDVQSHLKAFDAERYAKVDISDDGLRWDILAETAALLKSPTGPLGQTGLIDTAKARRGGLKLYSVGASLTGMMQLQFIDNGHHARARGTDGGPLIDGYLPLIAPGPLGPADAPVIRVLSESEYGILANAAGGAGMWSQRSADSDARPSRVREYEVAGASHMGWILETRRMVPFYQENMVVGGGPCAHAVSDTPSHSPVVAAALAALDNWARTGKSPPPGVFFELNPDHSLKRDSYGNVLGGVRTPWVAAPVASFHAEGNGVGPGIGAKAPSTCFMTGYDEPLAAGEVQTLYPSHAAYMTKVSAALDDLVSRGYFLPEEAAAERARADAAHVP